MDEREDNPRLTPRTKAQSVAVLAQARVAVTTPPRTSVGSLASAFQLEKRARESRASRDISPPPPPPPRRVVDSPPPPPPPPPRSEEVFKMPNPPPMPAALLPRPAGPSIPQALTGLQLSEGYLGASSLSTLQQFMVPRMQFEGSSGRIPPLPAAHYSQYVTDYNSIGHLNAPVVNNMGVRDMNTGLNYLPQQALSNFRPELLCQASTGQPQLGTLTLSTDSSSALRKPISSGGSFGHKKSGEDQGATVTPEEFVVHPPGTLDGRLRNLLGDASEVPGLQQQVQRDPRSGARQILGLQGTAVGLMDSDLQASLHDSSRVGGPQLAGAPLISALQSSKEVVRPPRDSLTGSEPAVRGSGESHNEYSRGHNKGSRKRAREARHSRKRSPSLDRDARTNRYAKGSLASSPHAKKRFGYSWRDTGYTPKASPRRSDHDSRRRDSHRETSDRRSRRDRYDSGPRHTQRSSTPEERCYEDVPPRSTSEPERQPEDAVPVEQEAELQAATPDSARTNMLYLFGPEITQLILGLSGAPQAAAHRPYSSEDCSEDYSGGRSSVSSARYSTPPSGSEADDESSNVQREDSGCRMVAPEQNSSVVTSASLDRSQPIVPQDLSLRELALLVESEVKVRQANQDAQAQSAAPSTSSANEIAQGAQGPANSRPAPEALGLPDFLASKKSDDEKSKEKKDLLAYRAMVTSVCGVLKKQPGVKRSTQAAPSLGVQQDLQMIGQIKTPDQQLAWPWPEQIREHMSGLLAQLQDLPNNPGSGSEELETPPKPFKNPLQEVFTPKSGFLKGTKDSYKLQMNDRGRFPLAPPSTTKAWEDSAPAPSHITLPIGVFNSLEESARSSVHMVGLLDNLTRALLRHFRDPALLNAQQAADMVVIMTESLIRLLNNNAVSAINCQLIRRDRALATRGHSLTEAEKLRARTMTFDSSDLFGSRAKDLKTFLHEKSEGKALQDAGRSLAPIYQRNAAAGRQSRSASRPEGRRHQDRGQRQRTESRRPYRDSGSNQPFRRDRGERRSSSSQAGRSFSSRPGHQSQATRGNRGAQGRGQGRRPRGSHNQGSQGGNPKPPKSL